MGGSTTMIDTLMEKVNKKKKKTLAWSDFKYG